MRQLNTDPSYVPGGCVPRKPLFIDVLPRPAKGFATVADLARFIQRRRGAAGLQIKPQFCAYQGSDTFPIFELHLLHEGDDQGEYIGAVAVQGLAQPAFEAALRDAAPTQAGRQPQAMLVLA